MWPAANAFIEPHIDQFRTIAAEPIDVGELELCSGTGVRPISLGPAAIHLAQAR